MVRRDPYQVLGVDRTADGKTIRRAYERLVLAYHPDKNPQDPSAAERLQEVVEAYRLLSDPASRASYDAHGGPIPDRGRADGGVVDAVREVVSSFLDELVGSASPKKGRDIRCTVRVSLADAMLGATKEVSFEAPTLCPICRGRGADPTRPGALEVCPTCRGKGRIPAGPGVLRLSRTCPACGGRGRVVRLPCERCGGSGQVEATRRVQVHVPPGIESGALRKVPEEGAPGTGGGPPGDLLVEVVVEPHEHLERKGWDVHCRVPVTALDAALGAEIRVPTLEGSVLMEIPAGTQPGTVFRIAGRGGRRPDGTRGDQYVRVEVEIPVNLDSEQKRLLREVAESLVPEQTPETARWRTKDHE